MKGLKDPKLSRKDSKVNNIVRYIEIKLTYFSIFQSKVSSSLDLEDMLNCRKSQHPHKSSQLFHNCII